MEMAMAAVGDEGGSGPGEAMAAVMTLLGHLWI